MRTKIVYLHAGMHKTGSTSLQAFLSVNLETLKGHGLVMPSFNGKTTPFYRNLSLEFGGSPRAEADAGTFEDLDAAIADVESDVLISWETFSVFLPEPGRLEWLVAFFQRRGFRLHVLGYVRDAAEYFNSRYSQEVKRLLTGDDFTAYLERELHDPRHDPAHLFGKALEHPEVDVTILPFERCARAGLEWSLLDRVLPGGYDRERFTVGDMRNEAPSPLMVYLSRRVREQLANSGKLDGLSHEKVKAYGRKIRRVAQRQGWAEAKFCGLDPTSATRIRECVKERADAFAHRVWGTPWPVAPDRVYVNNEFDPVRAAPELLAELERAARRVIARVEAAEDDSDAE